MKNESVYDKNIHQLEEANEELEEEVERKRKILLGSPINQKPAILKDFLGSLAKIKQDSFELHYLLFDDNEIEDSRRLLRIFAQQNPTCELIRVREDGGEEPAYHRSEVTHFWNEDLIWKVAGYKDQMIDYARKNGFAYLFLIDSDLLLHPQTIEHLLTAEKDIISTIFWTRWQPNTIPMPQVWLYDEYQQYEKHRGERITDEEANVRLHHFLTKLKTPGTYEVGGLGACTLISRKALESGVSFKVIPNLSFWGEDRHFCIRAAALGFSLFVDTHYPAYHIYRESDLEGANQFKKLNGLEAFGGRPRVVKQRQMLTLSMVVKNEANRYLTKVLTELRKYIDAAVIIDDGSEDESVAVCKEILQGVPLHLVRNDVSKFGNEINLRKQQWEETIKTDPDWILNLDADECFEKSFRDEVYSMINQPNIDLYCFRLYDFWDMEHYREDEFWRAHLTYRPFLVRYNEHFPYKWKETPVHCGRFPENIFQLPTGTSKLRLKHYGWAKEEDRVRKYERYMLQDPDGRYGWPAQYASILDKSPRLIKWEE